MDFGTYLRFALALALVLGLIGLAAWAARRFGMGGRVRVSAGARRGKRLAIAEALAVDNKRRLVLVRRDGVEHLLLLGPHGDTVVERGRRERPAGRFRAALDDAAEQDDGPDNDAPDDTSDENGARA